MNTNDTNVNTNVVLNSIVTNVESTFNTGCRFISLTYTNEQGETSKYNLLMGVRLESLYKSDKRFLTSYVPTLTGVDAVAGQELLDSINESITKGIGNNSQYTLKGYYKPVTSNGEVKLHTSESGETFLYVRGYVLRKTVITKGEYPVVKSSPKTIAKNKIRKTLKSGKLRTFKLNVSVLHSIRMNGMEIEIN